MKKIISKSEQEKKVKKNQLIIGLVLIFLMVVSTLGFAFNNSGSEGEEKIVYRDVEFVRGDSGYWNFEFAGREFNMFYNPLEVEDIRVDLNKDLGDYQDEAIYYVGNYAEPVNEIGRNLNGIFLRFKPACLDNENCEGDFPIKDCSVDKVIVIEEIDYSGEEEGIREDGNCVFIKSSLGNQTAYADAFLYEIVGV